MRKKKLTVEIEVERLQKIAKYYEFPFVAFLGGSLPEGITRNQIWYNAWLKLQKIKELLEE